MKQDLRVVKTKRTLKKSLEELLQHETFEHLTVSAICEHAFVNRVTFYSHYRDKYDLLEEYINDIKDEVINSSIKDLDLKSDSIEVAKKFMVSLTGNFIDECVKHRNVISTFSNQENSILVYMVERVAEKYLESLLTRFEDYSSLKYDKKYIIPFIVGGTGKLIFNFIEHYNEENVLEFKKEAVQFILEVVNTNAVLIRK